MNTTSIGNHRVQEAITFIGRRGPQYVENSASKEEKDYFAGILYKKDGSAEKKVIAEYASASYHA